MNIFAIMYYCIHRLCIHTKSCLNMLFLNNKIHTKCQFYTFFILIYLEVSVHFDRYDCVLCFLTIYFIGPYLCEFGQKKLFFSWLRNIVLSILYLNFRSLKRYIKINHKISIQFSKYSI